MKLSEAIRAGAKLGPQCFGTMHDDGGSCAIGAAFWALYGVEKSPVGVMHDAKRSWWPDAWLELIEATLGIPCPVCKDAQLDLSHVITHLNDDHKMSREGIAEYVETIEKKLGVKDLAEQRVGERPTSFGGHDTKPEETPASSLCS